MEAAADAREERVREWRLPRRVPCAAMPPPSTTRRHSPSPPSSRQQAIPTAMAVPVSLSVETRKPPQSPSPSPRGPRCHLRDSRRRRRRRQESPRCHRKDSRQLSLRRLGQINLSRDQYLKGVSFMEIGTGKQVDSMLGKALRLVKPLVELGVA
ncbi:unnamed protein product [Urochloa humidicola]